MTPALSSLKALSADWLTSTWDYRPSAFWFWNGRLTDQSVKQFVEELARNEIREFLIHPIHGMEVPYMSEEFFNYCRLAFEEAGKHGMKVWIYDEYGWPSGNVGGELLEKFPQHKGWHLRFEKLDDGRFDIRPVQCDMVLDTTTAAPWTKEQAGYLDTLSYEAVACFIKLTHQRFYEECGQYFGKVVTGFFTDEPALMMGLKDDENKIWATQGMPWTPMLPQWFKEKFGYDIESRYAELALPDSQTKRDYWALVKEKHVHAYHHQVAQWCRDHGLKHTGHIGEDRMLMQVRFAGSAFQSLGEMDEPGIDFLGCGPEPEQRFLEQVLVPSITRHTGRDRTYIEAHGISPWNVRLGDMLRRGQMFGIHGINDIALMGFHQDLDGIRKHIYLPPLFHQAPWWPFYGEYRDAMARSVGLTSLGTRNARYAILYPQNDLEQTDLMKIDFWTDPAHASQIVNQLAHAVYESGETFEFVFPEILEQATVNNGKIEFPNARYDALLAPSDLKYFAESDHHLSRLANDGGKVFTDCCQSMSAEIKQAPPCWSDELQIDTDSPAGTIRIYQFDYSDGQLFALRNVTDSPASVTVQSKTNLTVWDPTTGRLTDCKHNLDTTLASHSTCYFTLSDAPLTDIALGAPAQRGPIETTWRIETEQPNLAGLANLRFQHPSQGWIPARETPIIGSPTPGRPIGIDCAFHGFTQIPFAGEFLCETITDSLGILFEQEHLASLSVNGKDIDLEQASTLPLWDSSCQFVDIRDYAQQGTNVVSGVLTYQEFETSLHNDAYFRNHPMPTCDVFVAGSFRLCDNSLATGTVEASMPIDLCNEGFEQYLGIITLTADIHLDDHIAESVSAIEVELSQADALEVAIDNASLGKRITGPYRFPISSLSPGKHTLQLRLASTSAALVSAHESFGVKSLQWLY